MTQLNQQINSEMIVMARESRGMTQLELANKLGMTATNLGNIEKGIYNVSEETIANIADVTNYPVSFFGQQGEILPEHLNYRKREKVAQSILTPINAKINIIRLNIQLLTRTLGIETPKLPAMEVSGDVTPSAIAQKLRKQWKVQSAIVDNVTALLESHLIAISSFDFATPRVDSRCILTEDKYPVIIFNSALLGDRQRFSLAYQLGHLVMHTLNPVDWNRDISHEANLFAAEFLMPEKEIRKDFDNGITIPLLAELKRKWKVSMISLLYRADDLGYLTANQKRYLVQQFNQLKIRRREPVELDVPIEQPKLLRRWIAELKQKNKYSTAQLASALNLTTDEFLQVYS